MLDLYLLKLHTYFASRTFIFKLVTVETAPVIDDLLFKVIVLIFETLPTIFAALLIIKELPSAISPSAALAIFLFKIMVLLT